MATQTELTPQLLATPQELVGLDKSTPILLGLSGGADSRALLHLLSLQAKANGFWLLLAHVNHGIRGEEALRDRAFCERLAQEYGMELCILDADVPTLAAASGRGLEEEARAVRYEFFIKLMKTRAIPILVTAHHADDQLETMLFRLCRGTGIKGLGGMATVRRLFDGGHLVRPLLSIPAREIRAFCDREGLTYVTDSTNSDTSYARNRIRVDVIPVMETLFDDPQRRVAALAQDLQEDEVYFDEIVEALLVSEAGKEKGLSLSVLREQPKPILRRLLMRWAERQTGKKPERVHVEALQGLIERGSAVGEIALSGGAFAGLENGRLTLLDKRCDTEELFLPFREGITELSALGFRITVEKTTESTKINNLYTERGIFLHLNSDIMKSRLFWRQRSEGDRLLFGGMHRRLRRLYRAAGVSPRMRKRLPLLCDDEGIVWAPFVGVRDGLLQSGEAYYIKIEHFEERS